MRALIASILVAGLTLPASAEVFIALNRLSVLPVTSDSFEVIEADGAAGTDIWCAAGDYTRAIGRDPPRQRIYIEKPRGPSVSQSGRIAVVFTLVANDDPETRRSYSTTTTTRVGASMTVGAAYGFCDAFLDDGLFLRF